MELLMVMDEDQSHVPRTREQRLNDALQHVERLFKSTRIAGECEVCGQSTDNLQKVTKWNRQQQLVCTKCINKKLTEQKKGVISQGW